MTERFQKLVRFVVETRFDDLPRSLVEKAKRHILDTFGATLAGADSDIFKASYQLCVQHEAPGSTVLWGTCHCASPRNAALLNGIAAHALELDDAGGCDHSGAVVLPAVMAALQASGKAISGKELLVAVVIGYEVGRRVLEACGSYSAHNGAGWHSTATCGVFGAAAACARVFGLDQAQTLSALGIAGSFSGGLWAFIHDGSQTKKLHTGRAAEGGLLAVMLAQQGITGPSYLFDDVWGGFLKTLAGDDAEPEALDETLGEIWKLARCSIKPYASCRGTHAAIDAVGLLMAKLDIKPDQIAEIRVEMCEFLKDMCGHTRIETLASAQMSLPYALAARLTFGHAGLDAYEDNCRESPAIASWFERINLDVNPTLSEDGEPIVTLRTCDGREASLCVEVALGAPGNPISDEALLDKFHSLANRVLPPTQVAELANLLLTLEDVPSTAKLPELLSAA
ncbi:MmgE/PrpD family protein [Pseudomonas sp. CR3202]|uniref:MmgE/PrpD family protein n=1 Tax=Pseudomonas sp. CR3202 TaxID=3351532 RepID=UPI003BF35252